MNETAVVGSSPFGRRSTIAGFLFVACCHPFWLFTTSQNGSAWLSMMAGYMVAVIASCVVLRLLGFRLVDRIQKLTGKEVQFSILHLFIWSWTLLNGIFFSGLILVLRVSGKRLSRQ